MNGYGLMIATDSCVDCKLMYGRGLARGSFLWGRSVAIEEEAKRKEGRSQRLKSMLLFSCVTRSVVFGVATSQG